MLFTTSSFYMAVLALLPAVTHAALNGPCAIANGTPGICATTTSCASSGGTSTPGFCPSDPKNVQCCTKPVCGTSGGTCKDVNACESGNTVSGLCPGPASFKCCLPKPGLQPPKPGQPPKPATPSGSCPASRVNAGTIGMVKNFEGFVPNVYNDPIGLPTVGYGHLCRQPRCTEVPFPIPLTEAHATNLLRSDMRSSEECVSSAIVDSVTLNDNQYGALVSWAFNVGCGNVRSSGLVRRLNAGENPNMVALQELPKWRNAGGKPLSGLVLRRGKEILFFQIPSSVVAHPPSCSAPGRRR